MSKHVYIYNLCMYESKFSVFFKIKVIKQNVESGKFFVITNAHMSRIMYILIENIFKELNYEKNS